MMNLKKAAAAAVVMAAASCALQAHAATQSTLVPSTVTNSYPTEFTVAPVHALENTPLHVYVSGYAGGYLRCNTVGGCRSFALSAWLDFYGPLGDNFSLDGHFNLGEQTFGESSFGEFIDLTPVKFSTMVRTLSYTEAVSAGLVAVNGNPPLQGRLSLNSSYGFTHGQYNEFDFVEFALLTPRINVHYLADPNPALDSWSSSVVPEPATSALSLLGLAVVAGLARRRTPR